MILLDISVWFFLALAGAWTLSSAVPCRDSSGESFSMPSFSPGMCFWWENSHPAETNGCQLLLGLCLALLSPQKDFPKKTSPSKLSSCPLLFPKSSHVFTALVCDPLHFGLPLPEELKLESPRGKNKPKRSPTEG